ncbi:MAG: ABC transporter ATP-binding protein [Bacteroidota bacterium]
MNIELEGVGKRYKAEWIVRNVTTTFKHGDQYAITGPNGSGKSTLLKMLSGHLTPSKGTISYRFQEQKIELQQVYQYLTFAAPYIELIEELTLTEALSFHQRFKPFVGNLSIKQLIELLGFQRSKSKEIRNFSSGMKQRLKLVLALCSDTPLVLLDEPTTNLDQQGIEWYRSLIDQFAQDRTLIIASNVDVDFDFCSQQLHILDYKRK